MTPTPKDVPVDKPDWNATHPTKPTITVTYSCGCKATGVPPLPPYCPAHLPTKDAPVEPDFQTMADNLGYGRFFVTYEAPRVLMAAAFAAGRQAASQPEGGEQLRGDGDKAYGYLRRLFEHLAPQCEALPDLMGLCTQIDNYIAGSRQHIAVLDAALREARTELFVLCEDTETHCASIAEQDTEHKIGAFARGRIREAKSIRSAMGEVFRKLLTPTSGAADGKEEEG